MCFGRKDEGDNGPAPRPVNVPSQDGYQPPPGPPPGLSSKQGHHQPPAGPPPGYSSQQNGQFAPPPGPPPGQHRQQTAPQQDWELAVPDTTLFPPPPAIFGGYERSPTSNATEEEAEAGEEWCERYPMSSPIVLDRVARSSLETGNINLMQPTGFNGNLNWLGPGRWEAYTAKNSPDRCIIGYPPLYSANEHAPMRSGRPPKTIYYEVTLRPDSPTVFVALGFTALPYPSFRMPGWHRGSLAVHGDDGHKFINDRWGGQDFTTAFRPGGTYGIGMTLRAVPGQGQQGKPQVDIFFTRDGVLANGWALHEETDAEVDLPVTGLEGFHDLSCAIGTYDGIKMEVTFDPSKWKYNPYRV